MKKLTFFKSLLFVAVFAAALGACRSDELAMRERSTTEKEVAERADTFSLKLDFPSIGFKSKITAVSDEGGENAGNSEKTTRTALLVKNDGTTQLELNPGEATTMSVLLILRNQDGSKVYVSANNNWNIVKGQELSLDASGIYNFTAVKGASGAPMMTKDDVWYLDAMTGGEWDARANSYIINKNCQVSNHMFSPGEKIVLGKDLIVPFQLGTDAVGRAGERRWGVRMAVANNDRNSSNLAPRLVCIDAAPNFLPYGSLLCMRFRNEMHEKQPGLSTTNDQLYNEKTFTGATYSFLLRALSFESTTSTTGGWIQVNSLSAPSREPLPWHGLTPGGHGYNYSSTYDEPFYQSVKMDKAQDNNSHTGYSMARKEGNKDSKWTPYYYIWMKSIDESRDEALYGSSGLTVRMNLFNATLNMGDAGSRVAFVSKKNHKSGRAYFRDAALRAALSPSPVALLAPNFVFADPQNYGAIRWPAHGMKNSEMSKSRYSYEEMQDQFGRPFNVANPPNANGEILSTNLEWVIPDELTLNGIFPPKMWNINAGSRIDGNRFEKRTEKVRIGGIIYDKMTSYYYREANYTWEQSTGTFNYNTFYALRFVGTPFCEAVRYTAFGKWIYGRGSTPQSTSEATRYVIHTRHLGDIGLRPDDRAGAEKLLREVIGSGRPWNGEPHTNAFWGNFWYPETSRGITIRELNVPGSGATLKTSGFAGPREKHIGYYVGLNLQVAVRDGINSSNKKPHFKSFQIVEGGESQTYEYTTPYSGPNWTWNSRNLYMSVLPVLAPKQYSDPAYVNATR